MKVYTFEGEVIVTWQYVEKGNTGRYYTVCHLRRKGEKDSFAIGWALQSKDDVFSKAVGRRKSLADALMVANIERDERRLYWRTYFERAGDKEFA
jgi:hypothetical protein